MLQQQDLAHSRHISRKSTSTNNNFNRDTISGVRRPVGCLSHASDMDQIKMRRTLEDIYRALSGRGRCLDVSDQCADQREPEAGS